MKKSVITSLVLLAAISINISCSTGDASYKIVDTNQSKCFDNEDAIDAPAAGLPFYGQDAQHTGNTPSYTNNGDGTVTDNVTGLMWQKAYKVMSYQEALKTIETFRYAGYNDWRIPSIKEAYSLIIFSGSDVSPSTTQGTRNSGTPFIDTDYFDFEYAANGTRAIDSQMLSSTLYAGSTEELELIFGVNFADGRIKGYGLGLNGEDKQFVVRFVRGAEYGVNNFVDNGNGTVSDKATSLMWSKTDSEQAMNWQEALAYAQEMNAQNYLGHSDWRVPNAKELQSLVDYSRSPLSTSSAAIDPLFTVSTIKDESGADDYPFYWTSTTHENSAGKVGGAAVYVAFGRSLGNMSNSQGMGMQGTSRRGQGQNGQGMGERQRPEGTLSQGERGERQRPEGMQGERGERQGQGQNQNGQGMSERQRPEGMQGERGERQGMSERGERGERQGQNQNGQGMGERQRPEGMQGERGERQGQGQGQGAAQGTQGERQRPAMARGGSRGANWVDIHGAGSQRSDPKAGSTTQYAAGNGPQGDAIRINNYVRLVRDL